MGLFKKDSLDDVNKKIALLEEQKKSMSSQGNDAKFCRCTKKIASRAFRVLGVNGFCSQKCFNAHVKDGLDSLIACVNGMEVHIASQDDLTGDLLKEVVDIKKKVGQIVAYLKKRR